MINWFEIDYDPSRDHFSVRFQLTSEGALKHSISGEKEPILDTLNTEIDALDSFLNQYEPIDDHDNAEDKLNDLISIRRTLKIFFRETAQ